MRCPVTLTGREYKLLLDPRLIEGAPSDALAEHFWSTRLVPIIRESLDSGARRAEGTLSLEKTRLVRFYDTSGRLLDTHGFALRSRVRVARGGPTGTPEITLKLRSADLLLSAAFDTKATARDDIKRKFEEDIAPLQVADGKTVTVAQPAATYSRFSVSLKRDTDSPLKRLGEAFALFAPFENALEEASGEKVKGGTGLTAGPLVSEWVFENAEVDLGDGVAAEFGLTLWYFSEGGRPPFAAAASGGRPPDVAEISFDFDTRDGRVSSKVSRRAMRLFLAMQTRLPGRKDATSKTKLALP